jgi:hypothetical protein
MAGWGTTVASEVLTQMYIVMRTADANLVSGPTSYLLTLIQHILRKIASAPRELHSQVCRRNSTKQVKEEDDQARVAKAKTKNHRAQRSRGESTKEPKCRTQRK